MTGRKTVLYNGAAGRHIWEVYLAKVLSNSSLYQSYVTTIMVTPALGLIKLSLFIQHYLLFRPFRWVRISVWIGATLSAVFYIAVTITAFVLESPWPGETLLDDILSSHYLKFAQFSVPIGVIGMLVDWYLLILPIPAVSTLQMSTAKKLGVLIVFMTGGLAAIASTVSLYYRVQLQEDAGDPTWSVGYVLRWAQIEMFAGVAASSMPNVNQFFTRQNISFMSWTLSLRSGLSNLLSTFTREKLPDYKASYTDWNGSNKHTSESRERFRMKDMDSHGSGRNMAKAPKARDSQIHLTQDISITRERMDDPSFRLAATGRHQRLYD